MKFPPRVVMFWVLSLVAVFGSLIFSPGGLGSIGTLAGMGAGALFMLIALVFSVSDTKDDRKTIDELLADYSYLQREDIFEALRYAAWLAQGREVELASGK